jgi:low affinity Fe/Cu permease
MSGIRSTSWFGRLARYSAHAMGQPVAFGGALILIVLWAVVGPIFGYSDTWQLVINTGTTIITFLMVFLIQNTQNKDAEAMHIKLDELIRALDQAQNALLNLEELEEPELDRIRTDYLKLAENARRELRTVPANGAEMPVNGAEMPVNGAER